MPVALNNYPPSLAGTVADIRRAIDPKVYQCMTGSNWDVPKARAEVLAHGFTHIGGNFAYDAQVFEFSKAPDWVVKTEAPPSFIRVAGGGIFNKQGRVRFIRDGFQKRPIFAKTMRQVIQKERLDRIIVPAKYLCSYPEHIIKNNRKVFLLVEKKKFLNEESSIRKWNSLPTGDLQILARQVCQLIRKTGFPDLRLGNFGVSCENDKHIVIFDTEPFKLSGWRVSTILKSARIGLQRFSDDLDRHKKEYPGSYPAFQIFQKEIQATLKAIKREEMKLLIKRILQICSCLLIVPIPIYLYQIARTR